MSEGDLKEQVPKYTNDINVNVVFRSPDSTGEVSGISSRGVATLQFPAPGYNTITIIPLQFST